MTYRNLAAKNHESQTALHLASCHGHVEVVEQLVTYGAKVANLHPKANIHKYVPLSMLNVNLCERCRLQTMPATQLCTWPARLTGAYKTSLKCFDSLLISHSAKAQLSSIASNHGRRKPDDKEPSDWLGSAPRCCCQGASGLRRPAP